MRVKNRKTAKARPFLKWAGGKRRLLAEIGPLMPAVMTGYCEPFLGGGAVFFYLRDRLDGIPVVLNDLNVELINTYRMLRDDSDRLIADLKATRDMHGPEYYALVRAEVPASDVERAARFIYLNHAGFNGLYRENKSGHCNVPYGKREASALFDFENLLLCAEALQGVTLRYGGFEKVDQDIDITPGWFIYVDSPYLGTFDAYTKQGFDREDHIRLGAKLWRWGKQGASTMVSNADCTEVRNIYITGDLICREVSVQRSIAPTSKGRVKAAEVLLCNYA
jgi:DNA adenine methylase